MIQSSESWELSINSTHTECFSPSSFLFVAVNKIVNHGKVDISSVGSRLTEAMNIIAEKGCHEIRVGDRVKVSGLDIQMQDNHHLHNKFKPFEPLGTVRFIGTVDFVEEDEL